MGLRSTIASTYMSSAVAAIRAPRAVDATDAPVDEAPGAPVERAPDAGAVADADAPDSVADANLHGAAHAGAGKGDAVGSAAVGTPATGGGTGAGAEGAAGTGAAALRRYTSEGSGAATTDIMCVRPKRRFVRRLTTR